MTNEELEFLISLGAIPEEQALLEQQAKRAQSFAAQPMQKQNGPVGSMLSGLAGVFRQGVGAAQGAQVQDQQRKLIGRRQRGRQLAAQAMIDPNANEQTAQALMASGDPTLVAQGQYIAQAPERKLKRRQIEGQIQLQDGQIEKLATEEAHLEAPVSPEEIELGKRAGVAIAPGTKRRHALESIKLGIQMRGQDKAAETARYKTDNAPSKGAKPKPLPKGERDQLINTTSKIRELEHLDGRMNQKVFTGGGNLGNAVQSGKQFFGSDDEQTRFWADYKNFFENVTRHELFGSALTGYEISAWNNAQNIRPGGNFAAAKKTMRHLIDAAKANRELRANSLKEESAYEADAVDAAMGVKKKQLPPGFTKVQ